MFQNIMLDKNNLCSLFLGFILGYSVNYYNIKYIQNIEKRLEIIETKNLFLNGETEDDKYHEFNVITKEC